MNRERHKYWASYIADMQGRMLLADWSIDLHRRPPDGDACAAMSCTSGRSIARIWLNKDFDSYTRYEQRHYIVHELVHVHFAPLEYHLEEQISGNDADERARIETGHCTHEEYAVDDLARIIAPSLPLPPRVPK